MTPQRWQQIETVFQAAAELQPSEREAFLLRTCGDDADLRTEVKSLLTHEGFDTFIKSPIQETARSLTNDEDDSRIGQRMGAYRITERIGHGGMGTVYRAVRDDQQFLKEVALKLVRRGLDTDFVLSRFRYERQILATLEHTHIARLLDGGTTEDGLPYLVMDYVEGESITVYCESHRLTVSERLKLFLLVCEAVSYAHQKLVIHRDLKPGNIIVTRDGMPKLLDFGIAKLLGPDTGSAAAPQTIAGLAMMTPDYASPEEVRGLPTTTSADVYSLGVVLYELLTGDRPYRMKNCSASEIERAICETEAEKPSVFLHRMGGQHKRAARQLAGDLDNIVMMAMRKEPERRYGSVEQFAEDIRRYLDGRPVIAQHDTLGYRTSKFVRRHTLGLLTAALVIASLSGGIIFARHQARRAERRFQQVRTLANTFLFDVYDKIAVLSGSSEAREVVARTGLEYLDSLAQEAKGDPDLQYELAQGYLRLASVQGSIRISGLGQFDQAMTSYRKALGLSRELLSREPDNQRTLQLTIKCFVELADLQRGRGDMVNAPATMLEARRLVDRFEALADLKQDDLLTLKNFFHQNGDLELERGSSQAALENYRRAVQIDKRLVAQFPGGRAQHSQSLGLAILGDGLAAQGDVNGAIGEYRKALEVRLENVRQNPDNYQYHRELALLYDWLGHYSGGPSNFNLGDREKAEQYYRQALSVSEALAGNDPKNVQAQLDLSFSYEHIASVLTTKDPAQAIELANKALDVLGPLIEKSPDEPRYLRRQIAQRRLRALALQKQGDHRNAIGQLRDVVAKAQALVSSRPTNQALKAIFFGAQMACNSVLLETGERDEGLKQAIETAALAKMAAMRPQDLNWQWRLAESHSLVGQYHMSIANRPKLPQAERLAERQQAHASFQKALNVWDRWGQRAVSSIFNTSRREEAARALAQCDSGLASSTRP